MISTSSGKILSGFSRSPKGFVDSFTRPDGSLGNGWIDGHSVHPEAYEPLGIYDNSVVVLDPTARPGAVYAEDQSLAHPPLNGEQHVGIGCAWRDMGTPEVYLEVEWSGLSSHPYHVEGAPCVHFVPGSEQQALGMWPAMIGTSAGVLFIAGIGNPPEVFPSVIYALAGYTLDNGAPRKLGILTDGEYATFYMDGVQLELYPHKDGPAYGFDPFPIPANLQGSTLHGLELDTHFVTPWSEIPTTKVIHKISIMPA